ncbi:MAG: helix-turn-helix domain-containing protein [Halobacteria archaeon]|nr:helix-turn-helix domain-containing protein [Halobacteria archaeon]
MQTEHVDDSRSTASEVGARCDLYDASESVDIEGLYKYVFDLPRQSIDVCVYLSQTDGATVDEIADHLDASKSTANRVMRELVDKGVVEKRPVNLDEGGVVNLYYHQDVCDVKDCLVSELDSWYREAREVIEKVSEEKAAEVRD